MTDQKEATQEQAEDIKKDEEAILEDAGTDQNQEFLEIGDGEESEEDKRKKYLQATGKRKTAIAQVRIFTKGEGGIVVNDKDIEEYFPTYVLQYIIKHPLKLIGQDDKVNVSVKVQGGGIRAQAESVRHGISKALIQLNPNFRKPLKKAGYLTRDARKKERKKPGLKGARRAPQWAKR